MPTLVVGMWEVQADHNHGHASVAIWPYLIDLLRRLPASTPDDTDALEALLPDRWDVAHPERRLEQREEESREAQAHHRRKRVARRAATAGRKTIARALRQADDHRGKGIWTDRAPVAQQRCNLLSNRELRAWGFDPRDA